MTDKKIKVEKPEDLTRLARVRKESAGGNCAICGGIVELIMEDDDNWLVSCNCGSVPVPTWANLDGYSKTQYQKRFEVRLIPKETER